MTTVDFTIFVAIGTTPEKDLDGVLSICVLPAQGDFLDVSLLAEIEKNQNWNTIFVSMEFPRFENYYIGKVIFEEENEKVQEMTFGG